MAIRRLSSSNISTAGKGKSSSALAGYSPAIDEMDLIQRVNVGSGGAASIIFSSIPQNYQNLQLRWVARSSGSTSNRINLNINGDTTSTGYWHTLYGTGSSAAAYTISTAYIQIGSMTVSTDTANVFGAGILDIIDYNVSGKNRVVRSLSGHDLSGSGLILLYSGARFNADPLTSITLTPNNGESFSVNSIFSLYGVVS